MPITLDTLKDMIFRKAFVLLSGQTKEKILEDTKGVTNKLLVDVSVKEQTQWVNDTLQKRQEEIEKKQTPKELAKAKDDFRQQIYQASKAVEEKDSQFVIVKD